MGFSFRHVLDFFKDIMENTVKGNSEDISEEEMLMEITGIF